MVNYPTASRRKLSIGAADPPGLAIRPGSGSGEVYGPTRSMGMMPPADVLAQLSPQEMAPPPTPYPRPRSIRGEGKNAALAAILGGAFGGARGAAAAATGYLGGAQQAADADYQRQLAQYEDEWKRQQAAWKQSLDLENLGIRQDTLAETGRHNAATEGMAGKRLAFDQGNADRNYQMQVDQFGQRKLQDDRMFGLDQSKFDYAQQHDQQTRADENRRFDVGLMQKNLDHWMGIYTAPSGSGVTAAARAAAASHVREISRLMGQPDPTAPAGRPDPFVLTPELSPPQRWQQQHGDAQLKEQSRHNRVEEGQGSRRVSISEGGLALDRSREGRAARKDALAEADRPKPTDMAAAESELVAANQMLGVAQGETLKAQERVNYIRGQIGKSRNSQEKAVLGKALSDAVNELATKKASETFYSGRLERAKSDRADLQRRRGR